MDIKISPKEIIIVSFLLALITAVFFYKTFLMGLVPFPGDLLISEYGPWKAYSYLGYVPGSFPSKAQYFDVLRQLYPWKTFIINLLKSGELPLWNPYNFSGSPLLANIQSAVLYPLNILYFLLSQVWAWSILVILQPFLAGLFTYLFAREIRIGRLGAFLSSIAFSYSLYMSVFLEYNTMGHVVLWLPLSLFLIERIIKKMNVLNIIPFILSTALPFFAGHLQLAGFVLGFTLVYIACRLKRSLYMLTSFAFIAVGLGFSAVQLLPTLELFGLSARVPQSYQFLIEKLLLQPLQTILFISPDFFGNPATRNYLIPDTYPGNALYIGLVPLIFSLFSISQFRKNLFVRFFLISAAILLLLFIRSPISEFLYRFEVPLFSTGSPTNAIFLLSFSLALLSGFGLERWLVKKELFYRVVITVFIGIFLLMWLGLVILKPDIVSVRNFLYSTGVFGVFLILFIVGEFLPKKKIIIILLFIPITVFDLFYFFQKFNPFIPKELIFPQTPVFSWLQKNSDINRFWGYGTGAVEANFATQYKLFSPDGYDPLYPRRYGEFIQSSKDGKIKTVFTNQTRSDAVVASGYGEEDLIVNTYRLRILDLLGVKYILDKIGSGATEKTFPSDRFTLVYDKEGWKIFENKEAAPRAFLAPDYKIFRTKEEFEYIFFSKEFSLTKTLLLEEDVGEMSKQNETDNLEIISYTPNRIEIDTKTESQQLLFLSDTYYPGWKAFVDGKESKIYRANYAFRAIVVPSGEHTITFDYQPQSFSLGVKTTIISLILPIILALIYAK